MAIALALKNVGYAWGGYNVSISVHCATWNVNIFLNFYKGIMHMIMLKLRYLRTNASVNQFLDYIQCFLMEIIGLTRFFVYKDKNRTRKLMESFQSILNYLMGVPIQKPRFSRSVLNILNLIIIKLLSLLFIKLN